MKRPVARPGVPVWRTGKPDAFLAEATATAREAVRSIAGEHQIGAHLGARSEGERVVTHLFECTMPGYGGWTWFAVLTRVSRSKTATVNEVGLLPTEASVLAPDWVPWAERVRPEDAAALAEAQAADELRAAGSRGATEEAPASEDDAAAAEDESGGEPDDEADDDDAGTGSDVEESESDDEDYDEDDESEEDESEEDESEEDEEDGSEEA
nr:DUF3027 domain-containing protein [Arthrobacter sp. 35W]